MVSVFRSGDKDQIDAKLQRLSVPTHCREGNKSSAWSYSSDSIAVGKCNRLKYYNTRHEQLTGTLLFICWWLTYCWLPPVHNWSCFTLQRDQAQKEAAAAYSGAADQSRTSTLHSVSVSFFFGLLVISLAVYTLVKTRLSDSWITLIHYLLYSISSFWFVFQPLLLWSTFPASAGMISEMQLYNNLP